MGTLDGLMVVAIEQAVAAPMCTVKLADAGARVIKIERTEGETARNYDDAVKGTSAYFAWLNRGKESAVLDLKRDDELTILRNMLAHADVLVQNLAPGALNRMGLGANVLTETYPELISVSIVGYGQDTAYADMKAYDMLVQAESGLCAVTGTEDSPSKVGVSIADITTGLNAHAAVLEALIERDRSGKGQHIEIAMFDGMADCMAVPLLHFEHAGRVTARHGLSHASIYPYRPYKCVDGAVIIAVQNNAEFERLCRVAFGKPGLSDEPEYKNNADRVANRGRLDAEIEPFFACRPVAEAQMKLEAAGIAHARYSKLDDLSVHPALRRVSVRLPQGATAELPRPTGRGSDFQPGAVPYLGEHTEKVRREFL